MPTGASRQQPTPAERLVDQVEACLLVKADEWIPPTAKRLAQLLEIKRIKDDFLGWLQRAPSSHGEQPSQVTKAVKGWLDTRQAFIRSKAEAVKWLISQLSNGHALRDEDLQTFVVLGLQTVLWTYLPATHEFRACLVRSNLLPRPVLETLRQSFRVPYKRGALNWMTDFFIQSAKSSGQEPSPVVLHDAALDLRGRVAAEDLILGDRSVIGFPIFSSGPEEIPDLEMIDAYLVGYLFFGYPVPGLFDSFSPDEPSLVKAVADVRRELVKDLAHALDVQLVEDFAISIREGPAHGPQGPRRRPLIALASHDPAGSLAYVLLEGEGSNTKCSSCDINETAFMERIWDLYHLAEVFPSGWADPVVRHMQSYADLLEGDALKPASAPLAWLPRQQSEDVKALEEVEKYYPDGILSALNSLIPPSSRTGQSWFDWHLKSYLKGASEVADNVIHRDLEAALSLYRSRGGSHDSPHADLVVPITCMANHRVRVVGFLRFSCDSKFTPFGETIWKLDDRIHRFRTLFQVVQQKKSELDGSLGKLFGLLSEQLKQSACGTPASADVPAVQKEAFEALRLLCERITLHCTSALSDGSVPKLDLGIVREAFAHLPFSSTEYNELLENTEQKARALGDALAQQRAQFPLVTAVSLWPRVWQPVINVVSPESASKPLAELFTRDPGLPQLLTHLVSTPAWREAATFERDDWWSLSQRRHLVFDPESDRPWYPLERVGERPASESTVGSKEPKPTGIVFDFGLPARTSNLDSLNVQGTGYKMALSWKYGCHQTEHEAQLEWDLGSEPFLLGGASFVPGAVSLRVEAGLGLPAPMSVREDAVKACRPEPLENLLEGPQALRDRMKVLEKTLGEPSRMHWHPADLQAGEARLLVLFDCSIQRTVVNSFRNLALASAAGEYRGRVLERKIADLAAYQRQRASIDHGYGTAVKKVKDSLPTIVHLVRTQKITYQQLEQFLVDLQEQLDAIEELAQAAIYYARNLFNPSAAKQCTGTQVQQNVERVLRAFRSSSDKLVKPVEILNTTQLGSVQVSLVKELFIHGFARLVENALTAASGVTRRETAVAVTLEVKDKHLEVAIANSAEKVNLEDLSARLGSPGPASAADLREGARRGLGLLEARDCFEKQRITRVVKGGDAPYDVRIRLLIPLRQPSGATNGGSDEGFDC